MWGVDEGVVTTMTMTFTTKELTMGDVMGG